MKSVLCGTIAALIAAAAWAQEEGVYTANRFPGTARMWTAEKSSQEVARVAAHANRVDNPHGVTAAQIGALTSEADQAALSAISALSTQGATKCARMPA